MCSVVCYKKGDGLRIIVCAYYSWETAENVSLDISVGKYVGMAGNTEASREFNCKKTYVTSYEISRWMLNEYYTRLCNINFHAKFKVVTAGLWRLLLSSKMWDRVVRFMATAQNNIFFTLTMEAVRSSNLQSRSAAWVCLLEVFRPVILPWVLHDPSQSPWTKKLTIWK